MSKLLRRISQLCGGGGHKTTSNGNQSAFLLKREESEREEEGGVRLSGLEWALRVRGRGQQKPLTKSIHFLSTEPNPEGGGMRGA